MKRFSIKLITRHGSIIEKFVDAECVADIRKTQQKEFPGCKLTEVKLIKVDPANIIIFSEGDQVEISPKVLFEHGFNSRK
jgi:hypothetical protein